MYSGLVESAWKPRTSVRVRFAIVQGFFIAIIIGLLAIALYFPVQQRLVKITKDSYKILADNLAASIFPTYQEGNRQEVINSVRRVEGQQGVRYVMILDSENQVYYDSVTGQHSLEGKEYIDDLSAKLGEGDSVVGTEQRDGVVYYNYVSPFITGNKILYSVRLGVDREIIEGEFNRLARLFLYLAAFGILVGGIAAYFLAAKLTRPIVKLTESALAIRAGNLNAYPDISTNDELEQLSREFQNMVERLKQYYFQEYSQKKQAITAKKRLEEINERLHILDRQKTDFLNAASHQLRTPLAVIHWSLSMIVDEAPHLNLSDDLRNLLEESLKSTKRMVDLVNDLLDISRIEQGRKVLAYAKGNIGSVCSQLVDALQVLARNKNLELSYSQEGDVPDSFIDEKALYQVINNFVDNAIKYTKEGFVHVSAKRIDDHVEVRVHDSGIGMSEDDRKALFTRFHRGGEAQKMFANGSGLGMFVAWNLLTQHGGKVDVESELNKGTTFIVTVPIYEQAPEAPENAGEGQEPPALESGDHAPADMQPVGS